MQDETNSYVYGVGNLSQINASSTDYFLTDALGSTRQLVNQNNQITLAENYDPFGNTINSMGSDSSIFGFTGQQSDPTGLQYLRARYYDPATAEFITRDTWSGDSNNPITFNHWAYTDDNPVNFSDPSGHCVNSDGSVIWWEWPFFNWGPCSANSNPSTPTPSPSPSPTTPPTAICTPTVIPTPTPTLILLGQWKITYYVIALEIEFPADYVHVGGLQGTYRRQFIYSPAGVYGQGTGRSESGQYITIDWTTNNQKYGGTWLNPNFNVAKIYFKTGKGGSNGAPTAWETVAISQNEQQLGYGNSVMIEGYNQIFKVGDTGTFTDTSHLDVFIGEVSRQTALGYGTKYRNVWRVMAQ